MLCMLRSGTAALHALLLGVQLLPANRPPRPTRAVPPALGACRWSGSPCPGCRTMPKCCRQVRGGYLHIGWMWYGGEMQEGACGAAPLAQGEGVR